MRRCRGPGGYPDTFEERLRRGRCSPGEIGQHVHLVHPFTSVADARDLANPNGLGAVFGLPCFLWVDGDGNVPTVGPALTATGAPATGQPTPWRLDGAAEVTAEGYDGASYRSAAVAIDPADGDDLIAAALVRHDSAIAEAAYSSFGGEGIEVSVLAAGVARILFGTAVNFVSAIGATPAEGQWVLIVGVVDRDDVVRCFSNGVQNGTTPVTPAGSVGGGVPTIGARPSGGVAFEGTIGLAALWQAPGIADTWLADSGALVAELAHRLMGIYPRQQAVGTFTRTSSASWQDHTDRWHLASGSLPRAGNTSAFLVEQQSTNKVYNTVNPPNVLGWAITGGAHAAVADAAALATANADAWGPAVHQFIPGGADQVVYGGALTGAGPVDHSISVMLRGAAGGESVDVGLRDAGTGAVQNAGTTVLTTAWQHVLLHGVTPADVDQQLCLDCDAGDTVFFVAPQLETGARCTTPIPNWAAAAAATRAWDDMVTSDDPEDGQGSLEFVITPHDWSGAEAGGVGLGYLTGGGFAMIYVQGGTWRVNLDGTTPMDSGVAPADGVAHRIRLRWATGSLMSIEVRNATTNVVLGRTEAAYDGTLWFGGTWEFISGAAGYTIRDLITYRTGSG